MMTLGQLNEICIMEHKTASFKRYGNHMIIVRLEDNE